jgi:hypothetical protein
MADPMIERPLAGVVAFHHEGEKAEWSQAAQLVGLGVYLTGPNDVIADMEAEAGELALPRTPSAAFQRGDPFSRRDFSWFNLGFIFQDLPVPPVEPDWRYYNDPERMPFLQRWGRAGEEERLVYRSFGDVLWQLASDPRRGAPAAIRLLAASLYHESEIVRVAGAAGLAPLLSDIGPVVESVLVDGTLSENDTVRTMAAHALASVRGEHPALDRLTDPDGDEGPPEPARTSITVHGTFARLRTKWWKPGGDLHTYLKARCSPDLYGGDDHFRWDGRYDDACRRSAAGDLATWCRVHKVRRLDTVYAHSHGGNVALTAAQDCGVRTSLLVLLSTPAQHRTEHQWESIFSRIHRIVSVRSRFDLVVLADRSRLRFDSRVRQLLPPGLWFTHGSVLDTATWERNHLANEIAYERGLSAGQRRR